MDDTKWTPQAGFSRVVLPSILFSMPEDQLSMLLTQRVAQAIVQRIWGEFCQKGGTPSGASSASFATQAKWLGKRIASVVISHPAPSEPGESYHSLFVIPSTPQDGPRRYFTLELSDASATASSVAVLFEWVPADEPGGFRSVPHGSASGTDPQAFADSVERVMGITGDPPHAQSSPAVATPLEARVATDTENSKRAPWWQFWK